MLARIAPKFVVSRVIQHSYYARMMAIELVKQPIGRFEEYFAFKNAMKYYECRFYGYISTLTPPKSFSCKQEAQKYNEACSALAEFNEILNLMQHFENLFDEFRYLYNIAEKNVAYSNFFSKHQETNQQFEKDVVAALEKFNQLLKVLENYPEWKEKVEEELGCLLHNIYNNLEEGPSKRKIFLKMNRQAYFI